MTPAPTATLQTSAPVQQPTESRSKVPPLALGLVVGGGAVVVGGAVSWVMLGRRATPPSPLALAAHSSR